MHRQVHLSLYLVVHQLAEPPNSVNLFFVSLAAARIVVVALVVVVVLAGIVVALALGEVSPLRLPVLCVVALLQILLNVLNLGDILVAQLAIVNDLLGRWHVFGDCLLDASIFGSGLHDAGLLGNGPYDACLHDTNLPNDDASFCDTALKNTALLVLAGQRCLDEYAKPACFKEDDAVLPLP